MSSCKKPLFLLRLPMQLISFLLCILLIVALLGTALLLDMRILTSTGGIKQILTELVSSQQSTDPDPSVPSSPAAAAPGYGVVRLSSIKPLSASNYTVDENGDIWVAGMKIGNIADPDIQEKLNQIGSGDISLPSDIIDPTNMESSTNAIVDYIYEFVSGTMGKDTAITKDQVQELVEESTVVDYLADKVSSYADDILKGTANTVITAKELMDLVEENEALIEKNLQVEITEEIKAEIEAQIVQAVEEEDLNGTIRNEINNAMEQPVPGMDGMTVSQLLEKVRLITETKVLLTAVGICVGLMAVILLLNYYKLPAGLRKCGICILIVGVILSLPLILLGTTSNILVSLLPELGSLIGTLSGAITVLAPVHYGTLAIGAVVLVLSILWRILWRRKEKI